MPSEMNGFLDEIEKIGIAKSFAHGARYGLPWVLGFEALDQASKPPHLSLDPPSEKVKQLGKNVLTGVSGFGAFEALRKGLGKSKGPTTKQVYSRYLPKKRKTVIKKVRAIGKATPTALKRFGKGFGRLGLAIGGSIAVEGMLRRALKSKEPKDIPI